MSDRSKWFPERHKSYMQATRELQFQLLWEMEQAQAETAQMVEVWNRLKEVRLERRRQLLAKLKRPFVWLKRIFL